MQRAVANILDNELRHGPPGTRVTVSVAASDDQATLRVDDDGPGFPPELEARMFERFVKSGATGGHGLRPPFPRGLLAAPGRTACAPHPPPRGAWRLFCLWRAGPVP